MIYGTDAMCIHWFIVYPKTGHISLIPRPPQHSSLAVQNYHVDIARIHTHTCTHTPHTHTHTHTHTTHTHSHTHTHSLTHTHLHPINLGFPVVKIEGETV